MNLDRFGLTGFATSDRFREVPLTFHTKRSSITDGDIKDQRTNGPVNAHLIDIYQ